MKRYEIIANANEVNSAHCLTLSCAYSSYIVSLQQAQHNF